MNRRYGWSFQTAFGQFTTAATIILGMAFLSLAISDLLVARYHWKLASGEIAPPALRIIDEDKSVPVMGANVGDVPDGLSLQALAGALRSEVKDLPWSHALVRRTVRGTPVAIDSIFFPVSGVEEAFALCSKLANIPPGCTPVIATSDELRLMSGSAVTPAALIDLGVSHYAPASQPRMHIAAIAPPRDPVASVAPAQPRLQPAARADGTQAATTTLWLSKDYRPGSPGLVDVVAAGDVMMGSSDAGLNPAIRPGSDAAALIGGDLAGIFRKADIAFVNLEGPLYDGPGASVKNCGSCFSFRSPTYYAGVLRSLGVDVVSMANNHSGDFGEAGRESTMSALRAHGIGFAGLDRDDARTAILALPNGRKAAVVAFAPNSGTLNLNDLPRAEAIVRDLRKTHDLVIVSFHGGGEGWAYVHVAKTSEFFDGEDRGNVVAFAHGVIDAGADLVIGQGPHVPRAMELYRGRLIAYSLGNFWTYSGVVTYAVSGLGPVLETWLAPDGTVAGIAIHSSRQAGLGVPHIDPMNEAARYMLYLTKSDFPETGDRLAGAERSQHVVASAVRGSAGPGS
jgi:poly-gamma-glutamate capsule biosynthesis protein CapA/YwtB (metallophosphatase superfamily)